MPTCLEARLEVRTRSGDDLIEDVHYYDRYGREISEDRWVNIRNPDHRGPVVVNELIGPKWSNWSEIYDESGDFFRSPNPRRMVQNHSSSAQHRSTACTGASSDGTQNSVRRWSTNYLPRFGQYAD